MALNTSTKEKPSRVSKTYRTKDSAQIGNRGFRWWDEKDSVKRGEQLLATVAYLKQGQAWRQRQAAQFARLYSGQSLFSFVGSNMSKLDQQSSLAPNRPTFNLISSITNTLVSKLTQNRPTPVFLTDNGDYKERNLGKKLNNFILGEFYQTKAYELGEFTLTDALVQGTGILKIVKTKDHKVALERRLLTEVFVDLQEAAFGNPRRMYEVQLYDRAVLEGMFPGKLKMTSTAEKAAIDNSTENSKSVADLVMVVEGFSLPSYPGADDGLHVIACSSGELFCEKWTKQTFPYVFLFHQKKQLGFWGQGVAENQLGTQLELNSLLDTISKSIKLVGVPRVFYEEGSKVNKAAFSNKIGVLIPYRGTKPSYEVAPCVPQEMYQERERIIQFGFQSEGLSMLSATSQKPAGLNSGEAQRVYNDTNSERFQALERRYSNFYVDLAYQIIDAAMDIAKETGSYETVYTDRRKGTKEIDLPNLSVLKDPFVIQAYTESALPKDPAGRLSKVSEMIQSNMISIQDGMRLLDYPDLQQVETLKTAAQERIYCYLDEIIESGKYEGPDGFMPIAKAEEIVVQYINLYATCKLEEAKMGKLRQFYTQLQDLKAAAMPPPTPQIGAGAPNNGMAVPQPLPQSPNLPQTAMAA